jgi:hypothetical protein
MTKKDVLNDLVEIFQENTDMQGATSVHGVYDSLKLYMLKLKARIEIENNTVR